MIVQMGSSSFWIWSREEIKPVINLVPQKESLLELTKMLYVWVELMQSGIWK